MYASVLIVVLQQENRGTEMAEHSNRKRKKPLYSIEEICKNNGVKYDNSHSKEYIVLKDSDDNLYKVDSSFNIFENCYPNKYEEAKRLLKLAMEDMKTLYEAGKDEGCYGVEFKWRFADEAEKILNE